MSKQDSKKRISGLGGVFFKAEDKDKLLRWYRTHLGIEFEQPGCATFHWRDKDNPQQAGYTVFGVFSADTEYFSPSDKPFMFNFRVADLDHTLRELAAEGVVQDGETYTDEFGRFAWVMDPENNRIELWEPPAEEPAGD